jgi:L-asparaginase II
VSGGSKVLSVATCAGPARSIAAARTGSSNARRYDSTSGYSGILSGTMRRHLSELRVAVRRGGVAESWHSVHSVLVRNGEVVEARGDPGLVTFMRSAAKPFQALLLAGEESDLRDDEVAVACASHGARPEQLEAVRSLLARAGAREEDLECGPVDGSKLRHNCSGKHAGMLCVCRSRGWERRGYRLPEHPLQQAISALVAELSGQRDVPTATDGCGVVTFALPLERMAAMFARLARDEARDSSRVRSAMIALPELVEGPGAPATEVMRALPGAVAKGGAEGLLCVALPDGAGFALKVEDGASRATGPAAGTLLGIDLLRSGAVTNSRGEVVGSVSPDG